MHLGAGLGNLIERIGESLKDISYISLFPYLFIYPRFHLPPSEIYVKRKRIYIMLRKVKKDLCEGDRGSLKHWNSWGRKAIYNECFMGLDAEKFSGI